MCGLTISNAWIVSNRFISSTKRKRERERKRRRISCEHRRDKKKYNNFELYPHRRVKLITCSIHYIDTTCPKPFCVALRFSYRICDVASGISSQPVIRNSISFTRFDLTHDTYYISAFSSFCTRTNEVWKNFSSTYMTPANPWILDTIN